MASMRIPPIVWTAGWLGVQRLLTAWAGGARRSLGGTLVGGTLVAAGAMTAVEGVRELHAHDTSLDPMRPQKSTVLVTTGIYERSRNPVYLGMVMALAGTALISGRKRNLLIVPAAMLALHPQIDDEEMALIDAFGVDFIEYQQKTPRWA